MAAVQDVPIEEPCILQAEDVPSQHSKEAIASRVRWLIHREFGAQKGFIKDFLAAVGGDDAFESRIKNVMNAVSSPNTDDLKVVRDYFGVTADFLLYGELRSMPFEIARDAEGNNELRELLMRRGVELPDYLRIDRIGS